MKFRSFVVSSLGAIAILSAVPFISGCPAIPAMIPIVADVFTHVVEWVDKLEKDVGPYLEANPQEKTRWNEAVADTMAAKERLEAAGIEGTEGQRRDVYEAYSALYEMSEEFGVVESGGKLGASPGESVGTPEQLAEELKLEF